MERRVAGITVGPFAGIVSPTLFTTFGPNFLSSIKTFSPRARQFPPPFCGAPSIRHSPLLSSLSYLYFLFIYTHVLFIYYGFVVGRWSLVFHVLHLDFFALLNASSCRVYVNSSSSQTITILYIYWGFLTLFSILHMSKKYIIYLLV